MTKYFSGNEVTERESLLDTLSILEPAQTPLLRTLPHMSIDRRIIEFPIDRYFQSSDNIRSTSDPHQNTRAEGADWVEDTADYPTRLKAIAQIDHFSKKVSNSDRVAILAGVTNPFDYRAHQLFIKLLNQIELILMYGWGSPSTSGDAADERRTMGLLFSTAWTGLQRMHGTSLSDVTDPYGVQIPADYWSVFYNAAGSNLSRQMLYNKLLATVRRVGANPNESIMHVGFKMKNLIADFGILPNGAEINRRNVAASELMTYDDIDWIRTPQGLIGFRSNLYLDLEGSTFVVDNTGPSASYTPGSPSSPGNQSVTFQADETIVGWQPGYVSVGWYRQPHYQAVPTTGDYSWVAAAAEYALVVRHPKAVWGIGNAIA